MNRELSFIRATLFRVFFLFHWFELFEHFHEILFTRKKTNYNSLVVLYAIPSESQKKRELCFTSSENDYMYITFI